MGRYVKFKTLVASLFIVLLPVLIFASGGGGGDAAAEHAAKMRMLLFNCINFVLFVGILIFVLRKPVANFFKQNRLDVARDIEESAKTLAEAQKRNEDVKLRLDRLDQEIAEIKEMLRKEGEAQGDRILDRSKQMIEQIREDAKFQAEQQVKMARKTLQEEAAKLAVEAAGEILKKSANIQDHERLVGRFLREVKPS